MTFLTFFFFNLEISHLLYIPLLVPFSPYQLAQCDHSNVVSELCRKNKMSHFSLFTMNASEPRLTCLASSSSLQRSLRLEWGATSGWMQVWSLLDKMVMGTLEYMVRFSSWVTWVICLCVRVPKKILGMFLLPSLSFCPPSPLFKAHGHWEQGSTAWRKRGSLYKLNARFLTGGVSGPTFFFILYWSREPRLFHSTQIDYTKIKTLAHFLSGLVNKTLKLLYCVSCKINA